jgi:hypothetical protein
MIKLTMFLLLIIFIIQNGNAQRKLYRFLYRNEISLIYRYDKSVSDELLGLGYEFSLNKNKTYFSLANELSSQFFTSSTTVGEQLLSTVKVNFQGQDITSFGIGVKHTFKTNFTSFVATGGYKYDLFKYKLTLSANVQFEIIKAVKSNPNGVGLICTGNCPEYFYRWQFGLSVGKYF